MKIISWNVFRNNFVAVGKPLNNLILNEEPDILCLQEFPHNKLFFLEKITNYTFVLGKDFFISNGKDLNVNKHLYYNVILIKKEIKYTYGILKHERGDLRSKDLFKKPLSYNFLKPFRKLENESIFIDVNFNNETLRIYNSHFFCVAPPSSRINQFNDLVNHKKGKKSILIGDYNTFGKLFNNFFGISFILKNLYGLNSKDDLVLNDELVISNLAKENNLLNICKNIKTCFYLPKTQLDYILVHKTLSVKQFGIVKKTLNSDHRGIFVKI